MAQEKNSQFNFLQDYITQVLLACGYENLSEDVKREYIPQFMAHAETRIGASLLPLLSEESAKEMAQILKSDNASSELWADFWKKSVPNYLEVVKKVLDDFAVELKDILADIKK